MVDPLLATHVTDLQDSLQDVKKRYKVASTSVKQKARQVEEHRKVVLQETETHVEALKALQDDVASLKRALSGSLLQRMQDVLEFDEQL